MFSYCEYVREISLIQCPPYGASKLNQIQPLKEARDVCSKMSAKLISSISSASLLTPKPSHGFGDYFGKTAQLPEYACVMPVQYMPKYRFEILLLIIACIACKKSVFVGYLILFVALSMRGRTSVKLMAGYASLNILKSCSIKAIWARTRCSLVLFSKFQMSEIKCFAYFSATKPVPSKETYLVAISMLSHAECSGGKIEAPRNMWILGTFDFFSTIDQ